MTHAVTKWVLPLPDHGGIQVILLFIDFVSFKKTTQVIV